MFGEFIKQIRERQRLGLREFCMENGYDPSNWSKIEREVLSPPRDENTLRTWAKQLGLKPDTDDWLKFFDCAAVDAGRIPDYVMKDEELLGKLPAFFRTLSGNRPSREELENLIKNASDLWSVLKIAYKCSTPVIKRKGRWKPGRDYYYEYHLYCPKCHATYQVEEAKQFVEQSPSLF